MTIPFFSIPVLLPFFISFIITTALTYFLIPLLKKYGLMDDPKLHHHPNVIHTIPVPRGGSIPFFLGAFITALFFLPVNQITIAVFLAGFLALAVGVVDDKLNARSRDVSPYLRFFINILCAVIVVGSGVSITFITNPFGGILHLDKIILPFLPIPFSVIISIIWIIGVMNILNWSKGVDGQMPGIVAISAIVVGILALRFTNINHLAPIDVTLSFIIAGCSLGFLIFNFYPQKIMPGYGATAIYLLLAVVSMLSSSKLATAILVMGVPTVDALFTIVRRIFAGKSIFFGDNKHLHHILLRLGFSKRQVAVFYWILSGILGILSLTLQSKSKLFALVMLIVIVFGMLLFLHFVVKYTCEETNT